MRRSALSVFPFLVVMLVPRAGITQVYQTATPPPQVTAVSAAWQVAGDPVYFYGSFYYPAGASVFFDGNIMKRTGVHLGVPLYQDATIEPYSIIYVPIGRNLMRPYERRRDGELAGTVGSRTPSFPIQRDIEMSVAMRRAARRLPTIAVGEPIAPAGRAQPPAVAPAGAICCFAADARREAAAPSAARYPPTFMQSILSPDAGAAGVWILFDGSRWYLDGRAVVYDRARFTPIGDYRGFPVFHDNTAGNERIFVTVVADGPVAPFIRR